MQYGKDIGRKFYEDGRVRRYPGNTVVADIVPGCSAYDVMVHLREMIVEAGLSDNIILLPADSYHMTVIQGLNDQLRTDDRWPAKLPKTVPMETVDDHVSAAISRAGLPGSLKMKFDKVYFSDSCFVVHLVPANEEQKKIVCNFRNRAAEEIGVRLPGHDTYRFHISLGYTRIVPEGDAQERLEKLMVQMNAFIEVQPEFVTGIPYMAYFDNMYAFSSCRISRENRE